jgi:hypothetical protein
MRQITILALALIAGFPALTTAGLSREAAPRDELRNRLEPATAARLHVSTLVDRGTWTLRSYRNRNGQTCASHAIPGGGTAKVCPPAGQADLLGDRDLLAFPGARQIPAPGKEYTSWDNMWVYGLASPRVHAIELVNKDCSTIALDLDDARTFMHVVGKAEIMREQVPHRLVARDEAGRVVAEQGIEIGLPQRARELGLQPVLARPACR